jgi:C1A family cysteine protease
VINHAFGWIPQLPDHRDYVLSLSVRQIPILIDLRAGCSPVVDQGPLGSCTANAIAGALEYDQHAQGNAYQAVSRLFIYYNERVIEHTVNQDAGAALRDGVKSVAKLGAPPETDWPYDISRFTARPPEIAYQDALMHKGIKYHSLPNTVGAVQLALASGYPVIFGFTVYDSFETQYVADTGRVPMPGTSESVLGGHAVLAVGYNRAEKTILCRNSWGTNWGMAGYFTMPEDYFKAKLTSDLWVITKVSP